MLYAPHPPYVPAHVPQHVPQAVPPHAPQHEPQHVAQSALASAIGLSQSHVWNWLARERVPAEHCPAIERATLRKVRCEELRPDVDWACLREMARPWVRPGARADECADADECAGADAP